MSSIVDKIHPKMLKAVDRVGLYWQTCLFNVTWRARGTPVEWQTMH